MDMDLEEFLKNIEPLALVAGASNDEDVRRLAAALHTMKGSILAGGAFLEAYLDQQAILNSNMRAALIAAAQKG